MLGYILIDIFTIIDRLIIYKRNITKTIFNFFIGHRVLINTYSI